MTPKQEALRLRICAQLEEIRKLFKQEHRASYKFTFIARTTAAGWDADLVISEDDLEQAVQVLQRKEWPVDSKKGGQP